MAAEWETLPDSKMRVLFDDGPPLMLWLPTDVAPRDADFELRMTHGWMVQCADLTGRLRLVLVAKKPGGALQHLGPNKALRALAFAKAVS